jgi:putative phosphoribosyl transferase
MSSSLGSPCDHPTSDQGSDRGHINPSHNVANSKQEVIAVRAFGQNISPFLNRREAGQRLADALEHYHGRKDVLLLALPRGGVPVGYEIATRLDLPLDVLVVRKLGVPFQPELALGAIAGDGTTALNRDLLSHLSLASDDLKRIIQRESAELQRREQTYRKNRPALDLRGWTVILVDDGIATGSTMRAGIKVLRSKGASRIVVAVPVAARDTAAALEREVDEFICLLQPSPFGAVGSWYRDFSQTSDNEVCRLLGTS